MYYTALATCYSLFLLAGLMFFPPSTQAGTTQHIGTQHPVDSEYGLVLEPTPTVSIRFLPPALGQQRIATWLEASPVMGIIKALSQRRFIFSPSLTLIFGTKEGPLFDPQSHSVHIPYQFVIESQQRLKKEGNITHQATLEQATADTLLHTLLHEIGHAYIANRAIPVLGNEEDAVDNFATLLLLHEIERGDDIAIRAAELFALEDLDTSHFDDADFINEHSLDLQRYYNILCLVYGSNPSHHDDLFDDLPTTERNEQKQRCPDYFTMIHQGWWYYLSE